MGSVIKNTGILARKTLRFVLNKVLRLSMEEEKIEAVYMFVKFGLVGVSNTIVSYLIYLFCTLIGMHYFLSNFLSFTISVINSFYWNNKYVFKKEQNEKRSWVMVFLKTYTAYGITGLLFNSLLLYLEVGILHINKLIAPLFNLLITIPLNYIINKYWAYAAHNKKE